MFVSPSHSSTAVPLLSNFVPSSVVSDDEKTLIPPLSYWIAVQAQEWRHCVAYRLKETHASHKI